MTASGWLNQRAPEPSSTSSDSREANEEKYIPDVFLQGVKFAIPAFFEALSKWDGKSPPTSHLQDMATSKLLDRFQHVHKKIHDAGFIPMLHVEPIEPKQGEGLKTQDIIQEITTGQPSYGAPTGIVDIGV